MKLDKAYYITHIALVIGLCLPLIGCGNRGNDSSSYGLSPSKRVFEYGQSVPMGGGYRKVGKPYQIAGRWYYPQADPDYREQGIASWYGHDFHGRYTANGEIFNMDALSAAHRVMPLPSYARVYNLANGRSIVVRVNDRGPYAHERVIDLSRRAAQLLDFHYQGTATVEVVYMGPAPLSGQDGWILDNRDEFDKNYDEQSPVPIFNNEIPLPVIQEERFAEFYDEHLQTREDSSSFYVQVGSFRDPDNANRLVSSLQAEGYHPNMTPIQMSDGIYYRVTVAPIQN